MTKISLYLLLAMIGISLAVNPGLVGGLKLRIVQKIKEQYFKMFMDGFSNISIPDIQEGDLHVNGIQVKVENTNHNNVIVNYNEVMNGVNVVVYNTQIKVHVNWEYSILFFTINGEGDIDGPISNLNMLIGFETQDKGGFLIPKINIKYFDMGIDPLLWRFHFDCSACPSGVADLLLELFKTQLIDKIKEEARNVVNEKVADIVNEALKEKYPLTTPVTDLISVSLANTGPVKVKSNYLSVPLDATVFLTAEGYNRRFDAPEIPSENPENPGEIQLYASSYLYDTLEDTLNKIPMSFDFNIYGYDSNFKIDGSKNPLEIKTKDKALHGVFGGIFDVPGLKVQAEVLAETNFDFTFKHGDELNMVYVDIDFNEESLKFKKLKLTVYGYTFDLSILEGMMNYMIGKVINMIVLPTLPVIKIQALPLTATAAIINFFDTYTEAGLAFNFGLDN